MDPAALTFAGPNTTSCAVEDCSEPAVALQQTASGARTNRTPALCLAHRSSPSISVDGKLCRFCAACKCPQPLHLFADGQNVCRPAVERIARLLRHTSVPASNLLTSTRCLACNIT